MIDYKRAGIDLLSIHFTGNKGLGEELKFSKTPKVLPETALKDALLHFFISSFRSDRKSTRLNSSHSQQSRMPSSA